jgi:mRNA interferase MazF
MTLHRGDVGMVRFPHAGGTRGKKRPVVVVQADGYNAKMRHAVVAEVTSNPAAAHDPASLFIDISTPDGKVTGLAQDSVVCCLFLATVAVDRLRPIGKLSGEMLQRLNDCLKTVLELG